jgi:hypothetical protein
MLKKNDNGFALLPVALLLVVLIGGAAVFVLKKNTQNNSASSNQAATKKDQAISSSDNTPTTSKKPVSAMDAGFAFEQNTAWGTFTFTEDLSTYNENGKSLAQSALLGQYSAYSKENGNLRVEIFSASKPWPYVQNSVNGLYRYNPGAATWQKQKLDQLTTEKADTSDVKNLNFGELQFFKIVNISDGSKTITYQSK